MLRILLIAPALGLHTTPEVRDLSSVHRVTVLSDAVTARDVFQAARGGFDVIHYSTHSSAQLVQLTGDILTDTDLLQVARMAGAKLVFFNSCHAGRLAHYLVGHGVPLAVHTNVELPDADAWKMPLAYYGAVDRLGNGRVAAYVRAFADANDGEGLYGLAIAPDVALAWAALTQIASPAVVERPRWTWRQVWFMAGIVLVVVWLTLLSLLYTW